MINNKAVLMSTKKEADLGEWGQDIVDRWLGSSQFVSTDVLREKHWLALPVPDMLDPMGAEWLADAIQMTGATEVVWLAFEHKCKPDAETMRVTQESLLAYNGINSWRAAILTSIDERFLYFKDHANRYYLLCGDAEFISRAYRCTLATAKMMYFDEWVFVQDFNGEEKRFLTQVWNRYVGGNNAG